MSDTLQAGKTRWTHYRIAYHFVWIPKYRRPALAGETESACKKLVAECCAHYGFRLLALETDRDHVHCFVSAPPRWAPATIVGLLKGYTSRRLRERFPKLKRLCGGDRLWTQAYYVGTAGAVSAEVIRRYIQECQGK
ncbi:MAG: IS200/IS605 family transposase [Methylacidiphilaceae bacterium]|nr:IS200/IS605 family transposase [Candidatus Methylacidiphilaceae bacterium]